MKKISKLKRCGKCREYLSLDLFTFDKKTKDNLTCWCKECCSRSRKKYYYANRKKVIDRTSEYRKNNPEISIKSFHNYKEKHPERIIAHNEIRRVMKAGELVRGSCEVCGQSNAEAHHDDYSQPLEVRWLCKTHHKIIHRSVYA